MAMGDKDRVTTKLYGLPKAFTTFIMCFALTILVLYLLGAFKDELTCPKGFVEVKRTKTMVVCDNPRRSHT